MQFSKLALAAAATVLAGSALAAPANTRIAISSGASASKGNLLLALQNRCTGTVTEFVGGGNFSTYVCAPTALTSGPTGTYATLTGATDFTNFTGTAFAELRLNVAGGSFTAACLLANWPAGTKCPAADLYVNPAAATLATLEAIPSGAVTVGGLMDVEPTAFTALVRSGIATPGSVISAGFAQTFGVAVSNDLYAAMFADQAATLGAGCTVADTKKPECVPVIGKAQMASIMSSNSGSDAYTRGANFLAPSLPNPTQLVYARRSDTSGTQAAAQQYFLGNVCNIAGVTVVDESASSGAITVQAQTSTGNVRTQLNTAGQYSIGVMSGENNQSGQSWKWVRVGGINMAESAAPNESGVSFTNSATALNGFNDFWFLSRVAKPAGTAAGSPGALSTAFWNSVITGFGAVPANTTKGLFKTSETKFTRGGTNSCTPVTTN